MWLFWEGYPSQIQLWQFIGYHWLFLWDYTWTINGVISVLTTGISGHTCMICFQKTLWWTHNLQRSCSMFFFQNRSQPNAHHLPCFCTHLWFPLGTPARYLASWLWQPPMHLPVVFGNFEGIRQVGRPQLWPFTSYKYLTPFMKCIITFINRVITSCN